MNEVIYMTQEELNKLFVGRTITSVDLHDESHQIQFGFESGHSVFIDNPQGLFFIDGKLL